MTNNPLDFLEQEQLRQPHDQATTIETSTFTMRPSFEINETGQETPDTATTELLNEPDAQASTLLVTSDNKIVLQKHPIQRHVMGELAPTQGRSRYMGIPGPTITTVLTEHDIRVDHDPMLSHEADTQLMSRELSIGRFVAQVAELLHIEHENAVTVTGSAQDKKEKASELLATAHTPASSSEISDAYQATGLHEGDDVTPVEQEPVFIDATPQAIATLLTESKCPIAPTHAAALLAAGYQLMQKEGSSNDANSWLQTVSADIDANNRNIDLMVARYYEANPEAMGLVPERYWQEAEAPPRNPVAYDPAYTPEEQGLPSLDEELIRLGLMEEYRQPVDRAHLFDVDGPIFHPLEHETDSKVVDHIIQMLERGEVVCLNSGRTVSWMQENVITDIIGRIEEQGHDPAILQRFVAIGEKGGAWITYDEKGQASDEIIAEALAIPEGLFEAMTEALGETYEDLVNFVLKGTMISLDKKPEADMEVFRKLQPEIKAKAEGIMAKFQDETGRLKTKMTVDTTTTAVDIESVHAGKEVGADRLIVFLEKMGIVPETFVTYGDSSSDIRMAEELIRRGVDSDEVVYVSVGDKPPGNPKGVKVMHFPGSYSKGTAEFLDGQQ